MQSVTSLSGFQHGPVLREPGRYLGRAPAPFQCKRSIFNPMMPWANMSHVNINVLYGSSNIHVHSSLTNRTDTQQHLFQIYLAAASKKYQASAPAPRLVNLKYTSHNPVLQPSLPREGEIPTGHNYPAKHLHQTPSAWEHVWRATALIHSHCKLHCIGTK